MNCNLEIVFQKMPDLKSIRHHLQREVEQLDHKFDHIESCQISIGLPYHHRYPGNVYDFQIDVTAPGRQIKVNRNPSIDGASLNTFAMIRQAFNELEQKLDQSYLHRRRASVPVLEGDRA